MDRYTVSLARWLRSLPARIAIAAALWLPFSLAGHCAGAALGVSPDSLGWRGRENRELPTTQ